MRLQTPDLQTEMRQRIELRLFLAPVVLVEPMRHILLSFEVTREKKILDFFP